MRKGTVIKMDDKVTNNYDMQAVAAKSLFLKWDQGKLTKRNGIETDEDNIYVSFFNEKYSVNRLTGELSREKKDAPVDDANAKDVPAGIVDTYR